MTPTKPTTCDPAPDGTFLLHAPIVPGGASVAIGPFATREAAEAEASERFARRRELRRQDVELRLLSGELIARLGPTR